MSDLAPEAKQRLTLDMSDVVALTGLSKNSVYTLAAQNRLPGVVRFGRRVMCSRVALEKALAEGWSPDPKD